MIKRRGLSKEFTRDIQSNDQLVPSGFVVVPKQKSEMTLDPLEEIQKFKSTKERAKKIQAQRIEPLDKEKVKMVVDKINNLNRLRAQQRLKYESVQPTLETKTPPKASLQDTEPLPKADGKKQVVEAQKAETSTQESKPETKRKEGFFKKFFSG